MRAGITLVLATGALAAQAALVTFNGGDVGAGPASPRPNSSAAAASFDAAAGALGTVQVIDFELPALGNFAAATVHAGVTATLTGTASDANAGITNVLGDATLGYDTSAVGSKFLRFVPTFGVGTATLLFSFDDSVQAFGAYVTGLGTAAGNLHILFNNGSSQDLAVSGSSSGGATFFGFTDAGASIASVALQLQGVTGGTRDIFSVDDVRFVTASAVPEPGSLALLGLGLAAAAFGRRRKV